MCLRSLSLFHFLTSLMNCVCFFYLYQQFDTLNDVNWMPLIGSFVKFDTWFERETKRINISIINANNLLYVHLYHQQEEGVDCGMNELCAIVCEEITISETKIGKQSVVRPWSFVPSLSPTRGDIDRGRIFSIRRISDDARALIFFFIYFLARWLQRTCNSMLCRRSLNRFG